MIFCGAKHIELIKFVFRPLFFKVIYSLFRLINRLLGDSFLLLGYGIRIILSFDFFIELFDLSDILNIKSMNLFTFFLSYLPTVHRYSIGQLSKNLLNIVEADRITEIDESIHMIEYTFDILDNLFSILFTIQLPKSPLFLLLYKLLIFNKIFSIVWPIATITLVHFLLR